MINSIKIKKLFGRFNYTFNFTNEGIIIITGPNGYGKSTILKMIDNLCNDNFQKMLSVNFYKFEINCNESHLEIVKNEKQFKVNGESYVYPEERMYRRGIPPYFRRVSYNEFIDVRTNEKIVLERPIAQVLDGMEELGTNDKFFYYLFNTILLHSGNKSTYDKVIKLIAQINAIKAQIGNVRLIQEQRLIEIREVADDDRYGQPARRKPITVIKENSEKLKEMLASVMSKHSSLSSDLDSTYIKRLFDIDKNDVNKDYNQLSKQLRELQDKQAKLQKYGLAENKNVSYLFSLNNEKLKQFSVELSIYLNDATAKYEIFEDIIKKLDLYEQIVNEKLTFKKMELSRANGITVVSDNQNLSLEQLSSGEQEILVLFFKLIFESDVSLLMIDEPEISLHIAWQKEIMDNLRSIVNLNKNIQVIIATHSPQIISQNWDLQVDLGGQYNG